MVILLVTLAFVAGLWVGWKIRDKGAEMDLMIDQVLDKDAIIHIPMTGTYAVSPKPVKIEYLGPKGSGDEHQSGR